MLAVENGSIATASLNNIITKKYTYGYRWTNSKSGRICRSAADHASAPIA
jgi:hypothetical protein